jgi:glycosyltransferase involved in cell wall biosynthesis
MSARIKINWFSPLPPTRSEIARQTLSLLPELSRRAEVIVWCNDAPVDPTAEKHAAVKRYDVAHPPWRDINAADVTFYQMGNDPRYHEDIWRISRQHPGIVILHDMKLQHLFAGLLVETKTMTRREYLDLVERHHSAAGRALAEAYLNGTASLDELAEECPLSGAAIERALGVIVHSEAAHTALTKTSGAPIGYQPLYAATAPPAGSAYLEKRKRSGEPYHIILLGYLGPNRRLPAILKALALCPERRRFRLDIYGTIPDAEKIAQLACRLRVDDLVTLHGFASEEDLTLALERSHLALNLRYPSMGEASASQLQLWQYALPSLVSRTAWYGSLPDDTVGFVRPEHEVDDLQMHLSRFLDEPDRYRALGLNGQRYVNQHCTATAYADGIMEMAARAPEFQSIWLARDLAERAAQTMRAWLPPDAAPLRVGVAQEIESLVSGYFRPPSEATTP